MLKSWQNRTRAKETYNSPGRRLARGIGAVATTVALATITNAGSATAGPEHYGTDPAHTGCNQNAALIATRDITTEFGVFVSKVELFYSYSCQTNWIRVQSNPAGGNTYKYIRADGGRELEENDYGSGASYSMQVYAPGGTCVNFFAVLQDTDGFIAGYSGEHRIC